MKISKGLPKEANRSLLDILLEEFGSASRSRVKKMIRYGSVTVNGEIVVNPAHLIQPADNIEYTRIKGADKPIRTPFQIHFEDDQLMIVEKPAGMLTYGERGTTGTSLYRLVNDYLREKPKTRERAYVVHRLDREVSGLLAFAKSEATQELIKNNWKETEKRYYALVEGRPPELKGTVTSWLKENKAQQVYSSRDKEDAKYAITHYEVIKELPEHTLLEIRIETGRKHQIRVHMKDLGCPIAGDRKYGADERYRRRIRLHAYYLRMPHPVTGKILEIKTRMPAGFLTIRDEDENY